MDEMVTLVRADGEDGQFEVTEASAPGWVATGNWKHPASPDENTGDGPGEQDGQQQGEQPAGELAQAEQDAAAGENPAGGGVDQAAQDVSAGPGFEQQQTSGESSSDNPAARRGRK